MRWSELNKTMEEILLTPFRTRRQFVFVLMAAVILLLVFPVNPDVNDWELNTAGLWDHPLNLYDDPNRVYPPWGLILLIPFYLLRIEGTKLASIFIIGWLVKRYKWPFYTFFLIVLSPFFLYNMYLVNMDILVIVLPVLLWECSEGTRFSWIGRGAALSLMLAKPQATFLLWLYYLWENRKNWKSLLLPLLIVAVIVLPVSLIGSPPLFLQWIENLQNPSPQNQEWWGDNNISLTTFFSPVSGVLLVILSGWAMRRINKWKKLGWEHSAIMGSLVVASMSLSPYTSRQSASAGLALLPSPVSFFSQWFCIMLLPLSGGRTLYWEPLWVFLIFVLSAAVYPFWYSRMRRLKT